MTNESTPRPGGSEGTVTASEAVPNRVTAPGDTARARRRWWLDRQRNRRRVSYAFDAHLVRMYGAKAAAEYGIRDRRGWGG